MDAPRRPQPDDDLRSPWRPVTVPLGGPALPFPPGADHRARPGPMAGAYDWTWCLELDHSFSSLLDVSGALVTMQQRPGDEAETGGSVLNLYLVTCALDQVLSDHLHRGFRDFTRLGAGPALRMATRTQQAARRRSAAWRSRGLTRRQRELAALARALAGRVLDGERAPGREAAAAVSRLRAGRWPLALRRSRMQTPESMRGGGLYPEDCERLAALASESRNAPDAPVLVVGLRPAGLYLAPLCAVALERRGHRNVSTISLRPGVPLLSSERAHVRKVAATGGWALVVDGSSRNGVPMARAIEALTGLGLTAERICLAAPAIEDAAAGGGAGERSAIDRHSARARYTAVGRVSLEPEGGRVHALLTDAAVEHCLERPEVLGRLGADHARVLRGGLEPAVGSEAPPAAARDDPRLGAWRLFEVELRSGDERWVEHLLARGVGLGFFGYHSCLVSACLGDLTPEVVSIRDGIALVRWNPGEGAPEPVRAEELEDVAAYVAARARRLDLGDRRVPAPDGPVSTTAALRVARLFSRPLRGAGLLIEPGAAAALARAMAPPRHCIVDGCMGPHEWVRSGGRLLKVNPGEDGGDRVGGATDPLYDLADAAMRFRLEPEEERVLLDAYVRLVGEPPGLDTRLTFHKLAVGAGELAALGEAGDGTEAGRLALARGLVIGETMLTRALNGYLARQYLTDVEAGAPEQLWALRLEGVLETDRPGFPGTSPAAVAALRMLRAHGREVVLITGHSLGELRERCQTFNLWGGVAEQGAVVWDERRREATPLTTPDQRRALAALRSVVLRQTDMLADPRYQHSLCLFRHGPGGRRGVRQAEVRDLMDQHGVEGLEVDEGPRGTTVRPVGVGLATALRRLRSTLPETSAELPLHVVAGLPCDIELLTAAEGRYAPGSVGRDVQQPGAGLKLRVASRPYQVGLLEVVRAAVHGWSRGCRRCAPPRPEEPAATLLRLVGLQDRGRWARLALALGHGSLRGCEL